MLKESSVVTIKPLAFRSLNASASDDPKLMINRKIAEASVVPADGYHASMQARVLIDRWLFYILSVSYLDERFALYSRLRTAYIYYNAVSRDALPQLHKFP